MYVCTRYACNLTCIACEDEQKPGWKGFAKNMCDIISFVKHLKGNSEKINLNVQIDNFCNLMFQRIQICQLAWLIVWSKKRVTSESIWEYSVFCDIVVKQYPYLYQHNHLLHYCLFRRFYYMPNKLVHNNTMQQRY